MKQVKHRRKLRSNCEVQPQQFESGLHRQWRRKKLPSGNVAVEHRKRRGRGEGSVYRRKSDGLWVAVRSSGFHRSGRPRRQYFYAKTKSKVLQLLRDAEPVGRARSRVTVAGYIATWLTQTKRPSVAPSTYDSYQRIYSTRIRNQLVTPLRQATTDDIEHWQDAMAESGFSPDARRKALLLVRQALADARRRGLVAHNAATECKSPRIERPEMKVLSATQLQSFLDAAKGDRYYALFAFAIGTGARQGECFALQWSDIDWTAGTASIQRSLECVRGRRRIKPLKTKYSRRSITLPQFVVDALSDHRKAQLRAGRIGDYVFVNSAGGLLFNAWLTKHHFRPLLQQAGLPAIRWHDLRHSHATVLLESGQDALTVSRRLGHSSVAVTLGYYGHVTPRMQQGAADLFSSALRCS